MVMTNVMPTYAADPTETTSISTEETKESEKESVDESEKESVDENTKATAQTPTIELSKTSFPYNGIKQTPAITVCDEEGNPVSDEYYTVIYPENSIDVGTYTVEVVFSEPYTGTVTADYEITPIELSNAEFSIPAEEYLYSGEAIEPAVSCTRYVEDVDYTVAYENNIDDGTATVVITGIGNYTGTTILPFDIKLFNYSVLEDNKICVTEVWKDITGALEIPAQYRGYTVTAIDCDVFKSCKKLTSITTPDTLQNVGENAFYGCTALTTVNLNGTGVSLGYRAFYNCRELQSVTAKDLQSIGGYCFEGCNKLEKVEVEEGIESIGTYAFNKCLKLKTVEIGTSVTIIGAYAFNRCFELVSIGNMEYNDSFGSIGECAFYECKKLTSIDLSCSRIDKLEQNTFYGCESLKSVGLPITLTSIGGAAFKGCKALEVIALPDNLTNIEGSAFEDCISLASIEIPNGVTSISNYMFEGCTGLKTVTLPEGINHIGYSAFSE